MTSDWSELFFAWNVPMTPGLSALQASLCGEFGITPRSECHVTLGHIGACSEQELRLLLEDMSLCPLSILVNDFEVMGVGAAFRRAGSTAIASISDLPTPNDEALVLWLMLNVGPLAEALHARLFAAVTRLGIRSHLLRERFDPHLTIGSRSTMREAWDDYWVNKNLVFRSAPLDFVRWDCLYVANGSVEISKLAIAS